MSKLPHSEFKALLVLINGLTGELETRLKAYKLSSSAFLALDAIASAEASGSYPMTRASLARMINTTPGSVSVLIGRLLREGLVSESRLNERSKALATTRHGRSMLAGGSVAWEDTFSELSEALSATARKQFLQTITKLNLVRRQKSEEADRIAYMRTLSRKETREAVTKHQEQSRRAAARAIAELD